MSIDSDWVSSMSPFRTFLGLGTVVFAVSMSIFLFLRTHLPKVYEPRVARIGNDQSPSFLVRVIRLLSRSNAEIIQNTGLDGFLFLRYLSDAIVICLLGIFGLYPTLLLISYKQGTWQPQINTADAVSWQAIRSLMLEAKAHSRSLLTSGNGHFSLAHVTAINFYLIIILCIISHELSFGVLARHIYMTSPPYSDRVSSRVICIRSLPEQFQPKMLVKRVEILFGTPVYNPTLNRQPFFLRKVDVVSHLVDQNGKVDKDFKAMQRSADSATTNWAFIYSHTLEQAHDYLDALWSAQSRIGVKPEDVVWSNLGLSSKELPSRELAAYTLISVYVGVSILLFISVCSGSNLGTLEKPFAWVDNILPTPLFDLDTSVSLPILLYVHGKLMVTAFRRVAVFSGSPTHPCLQNYIQMSSFVMQVVQLSSLLGCISDAAAASDVITMSNKPYVALLAENMPRVSNICVTYSLLHGFSSAYILLQPSTLFYRLWLGWFGDESRRNKWNRERVVDQVEWGPIYAESASLVAIGIIFMSINPWLLVCNVIGFALQYVAYSSHLTFVVRPMESRGIYFPRAMFQTVTGVYVAQIVMFVYLWVHKPLGWVPLQALFIWVTYLIHGKLSAVFDPLFSLHPRCSSNSSSGTRRTSKVKKRLHYVISTWYAFAYFILPHLSRNVVNKSTSLFSPISNGHSALLLPDDGDTGPMTAEKFALTYRPPTKKRSVPWTSSEKQGRSEANSKTQ